MKIYTKTGDNLTTSIISERVDKDNLVVEVNGTVDEASANLMLVSHYLEDTDIKKIIIKIINQLMNLSASLVMPDNYLTETDVKEIENLIDFYDEQLPPLTAFILPGNAIGSTHLHVSRTIIRRLERRLVTLAKAIEVDTVLLQYVNRLSDLLFVLARFVDEN